jgi:hypothetical protein
MTVIFLNDFLSFVVRAEEGDVKRPCDAQHGQTSSLT